MEPPPSLPDFIAQNSKKRVFSASSSSASSSNFIDLEADVVEVPKQQKQKQVIACEIIDIDEDDDDEDDVVFLDEIKGTDNKGKGSLHETEVHWSRNGFGSDSSGFVNGVHSSNSFAHGSYETVSTDSNGPDNIDDAIYNDSYIDDIMDDVEELAVLQAHFDSMDLPTGVEAPLPWYLDPAVHAKKSAVGNGLGTNGEPKSSKLNSASASGSSSGGKVSSSWQFPQPPQTKPGIWQHQQPDQIFHTWVKGETPKAYASGSMLKSVAPSSSKYSGFNQVDDGNFHFQAWPTIQISSIPPSAYDPVGAVNTFPQVGPHMQWFPSSTIQKNTTSRGSGANTSESVPGIDVTDLDNILKRFELFKKFEIVEDYSDHKFSGNGSSASVAPKDWAKKIQREWKILEDHLPDMIFVRAYESRMDLLRAVIIGAEGTPYHDGVFFFDVFFPSQYPNIPPKVYYHSGGLRINPNLYNEGKVCLSLLNTWQGDRNEKWIPGKSNMLQVLVSIQGLILNEKPYFNEPGYAHMSGSESGEVQSRRYNENTFTLSLRTMSYSIRRPPKHFEDFVVGHFHKRAHDILAACKAYTEGTTIGSFVKGSTQAVNQAQNGCSATLMNTLAEYVNMLVKDFTSIGIKDCEAFIIPLENLKGRSTPPPPSRRSKYSKGIHIGNS